MKQHDEVVRWKALAEQREQELAIGDKQVAGWVKAVKTLDSAFAKATKKYEQDKVTLDDSTKRLSAKIASLSRDIQNELPDSSKAKVAQLVYACNQKADMIYSALAVCDALRRQGLEAIARRDTIIFGVQKNRDGYKKLYEEASKHVKGPSKWEYVGKTSALVGAALIVGRLIHLW